MGIKKYTNKLEVKENGAQVMKKALILLSLF